MDEKVVGILVQRWQILFHTVMVDIFQNTRRGGMSLFIMVKERYYSVSVEPCSQFAP